MNPTSKALVQAAIALGLLVLAGAASAQSPGNSLEQGFKDPPDPAKLRVWWHGPAGECHPGRHHQSLDVRDERVCLGGAQIALHGQGGGQVIAHPITFFTPEWFDAVRHAAAECDWLGLEMSIFMLPEGAKRADRG